jgi:hypothetical protein
MLVLEYAQLREDERHAQTTSIGLITLILALAAAITTVLVVTDVPRDAIPVLVFIAAPVLPIGVFAYVAGSAVANSYRIAYLREIEASLLTVGAKTDGGWPVPSYTHALFELWYSVRIAFVWYIVDTAAVVVFGALTLVPIWSSHLIWVRASFGVIYAAVFVYISAVYLTAYWRPGHAFSPKMREAIHARLMDSPDPVPSPPVPAATPHS